MVTKHTWLSQLIRNSVSHLSVLIQHRFVSNDQSGSPEASEP
jgi:hypothetical protein